MALKLYSHPLASFCWKSLIALYENGTPFEMLMVNLGDPEAKAKFEAMWPTAKIPLLEDDGRIVPETTIMIEYLDRRHPGKVVVTASRSGGSAGCPTLGPRVRSLRDGPHAALHRPTAPPGSGA